MMRDEDGRHHAHQHHDDTNHVAQAPNLRKNMEKQLFEVGSPAKVDIGAMRYLT